MLLEGNIIIIRVKKILQKTRYSMYLIVNWIEAENKEGSFYYNKVYNNNFFVK